ncbi:MAG: hypothetical protein Q7T00_04915 [Rugosibacter sp.]|nr:hypothetical protein [Rugosibacter sp.]
MTSEGYAIYLENKNQLEVVRPGENTPRYIHCTNLSTTAMKVHGVQIHGDEIWVLVGPHSNPRPDRKMIYRFSSLASAGSTSL